MAKLEHLLKSRSNGNTDPIQAASLALLTKLSDDRGVSTTQLANAIAQGLDALHRELVKAIKSVDSSQGTASIEKAVGQVGTGIGKLTEQLTQVTKEAAKDRQTLGNLRNELRAFREESKSGPMTESIDRLRDAVQGVEIPSPDLSPVLNVVRTQERLDKALAELNKRLDRSEEWTFSVEREDFSDKIKQVRAVQVA